MFIPKVGNCDIDLFIFHRCFCIMIPKFMKFKRGWNAAENVRIGINEIVKLLKFNQRGWNYLEINIIYYLTIYDKKYAS